MKTTLYNRVSSFSFSSANKVAVIGLGNMGIHMAHNLSQNYEVYGFDANHSQAQQSIHEFNYPSINLVQSFSELPANVDSYVLSLPSNQVCHQVVHQIKETNQSDKIILDCSTISPKLVKQLHSLMDQSNNLYIDSPMSGGVPGSKNKTLTFMLGMDDNDNNSKKDKINGLLNSMGHKIVYCGGIAKGQSAKLVNNLALAIQMVSICETFGIGKLFELDPTIQFNIFKGSTARCWSVDTYVPVEGMLDNVPANRNYEGGFMVDLLVKDLGLLVEELESIIQEKEEPGIKEYFEVSMKVIERYRRLQDKGLGRKDFGVMMKDIYDHI